MVKFLSPAGVTPVLAPPPPPPPTQPALPAPNTLPSSLHQTPPSQFLPPKAGGGTRPSSAAAGGGGGYASPLQSLGCAGMSTPQTPFRTPKSVLRKPGEQRAESRILGTPDYLAPELLLRQGTYLPYQTPTSTVRYLPYL